MKWKLGGIEGIKLLYYPPIMENQTEKKMETGGNTGIKELKLSYYPGEALLFTIYIYIPIMVT